MNPLWMRLKEKGQAIVEFAIILPFLIMFVLGIMYGGFLYSDYEALNDLARTIARDASMATSTSYYDTIRTKYIELASSSSLLPNNLYVWDPSKQEQLKIEYYNTTEDGTSAVQIVKVTLSAELNPDSSSLSGTFSAYLGSVINPMTVTYSMYSENDLSSK